MIKHNYIKKNYEYIDEADILIRVYETQIENVKENELFCGEVLFRPYLNIEHERFTSPYPKGLVYGIINVLKKLKKKYTIQISNELPYKFHHLNSCDYIFEETLNRKLKIKYT